MAEVNSHIQLPKFILKNFMNTAGKVNHLNLEDCSLHALGPKQLGVQKGYYSKDMEQYLCRQIEQPFSVLVDSVNTYIRQGERDPLKLPFGVEIAIKRYISAAYYRSEHAYAAFLAGSYTSFLYNDQANHDHLLFVSTQQNEGVFPGLEKHRIMVLVNNTDRPLVVPRNCFYTMMSCGMPCFIAPVSPACAIGLLPEEYPATNDQYLWYIDNPNDIGQMNIQALHFEYIFNRKFVASINVSELEQLRVWLQDRHDMLESERNTLIRQLRQTSENEEE